MSLYLSLHREAATKALKQLFKQPVASFLILLMLAIAMTLPLSLYLGVKSGQQILGHLNEVPTITIYMELNADPADTKVVNEMLKKDEHLAKIEYIDKQQGLMQLQENMGGQDLVSMLDENPLPDVFVVTPKKDTPDALEYLQSSLTNLPMVESVKMDAEWMQTLYQINQFVYKVLWLLAITLSVAFILVAHNTIRLQILTRKDEIDITKLLGAPASFIRRPFLYLAAWQSMIAAIFSLGMCWWLSKEIQPLISAIIKPYGINLQWQYFNPLEIILVLCIVIALGVLGAWLATSQYLLNLKMKR